MKAVVVDLHRHAIAKIPNRVYLIPNDVDPVEWQARKLLDVGVIYQDCGRLIVGGYQATSFGAAVDEFCSRLDLNESFRVQNVDAVDSIDSDVTSRVTPWAGQHFVPLFSRQAGKSFGLLMEANAERVRQLVSSMRIPFILRPFEIQVARDRIRRDPEFADSLISLADRHPRLRDAVIRTFPELLADIRRREIERDVVGADPTEPAGTPAGNSNESQDTPRGESINFTVQLDVTVTFNNSTREE